MKAQTIVEYMVQYSILIVSIIIFIVFSFKIIQNNIQDYQRYNLFVFEQYIKGTFDSASRLGPGGYVVLYLPDSINGESYLLEFRRNPADYTSGSMYLTMNRSNYTYSFDIRSGYSFEGDFNLSAGNRYIIEINYQNRTIVR